MGNDGLDGDVIHAPGRGAGFSLRGHIPRAMGGKGVDMAHGYVKLPSNL